MRKLTIAALSFMGAYVAFCGYLVFTGHEAGHENLWCPNLMYRVKTPTVAPEAIDAEARGWVEVAKREDVKIPLATTGSWRH